MKNLPQLPREPLRELLETDVDAEMWQPTWRCFCCEDTGVVRYPLVLLLISDYDRKHDKDVACQQPRCTSERDYLGDENYDQRFDAKICTELDKINRENWRNYAKTAFESAQKAKAAIDSLVGKVGRYAPRERTENDEREIQIRKEEIETQLQRAHEAGLVTTDVQTGEIAF